MLKYFEPGLPHVDDTRRQAGGRAAVVAAERRGREPLPPRRVPRGRLHAREARSPTVAAPYVTVFGHYKVDAKGMNAHEGLTFQILKGQRRVVWPDKCADHNAPDVHRLTLLSVQH
jgi:hypothetical protein